MPADRPIGVLAIVEAEAVTGPVRNLLQFQRAAALAARDGAPRVQLTLAAFERGIAERSALRIAAETSGVAVLAVTERFRFDAGAIASIRRLVDMVDPDVVQTHGVKSHFLVRLARLSGRQAWIAFHHGYTRPDAKMAFYNQCDRVTLRAAARVVVPTAAFIAELQRAGVARERIRVIPNAFELRSDVDIERAALREPLRASLGIAPHEQLIACIGRLSLEKGHADLVDAMALLRAQWPELPVRLVVAGDGPERERLRARAGRAGVSDAIRWLGFVSRAEHLYAAADVAVLASHSEGSPNALLEAAAYTVPIVTTGVGGVCEMLVHGESGVLVPPRRPGALADGLRQVLSDPGSAAEMARRARQIVETRYQPSTRAHALISLYRQVADRLPHAPAAGATACAC